MKMETFETKNVAEDGTVKDGGAVITTGAIRRSHPDGGCGTGNCSCSPGHWVSIIEPRTEDGIVKATKIHFESREEMEEYLKDFYTK